MKGRVRGTKKVEVKLTYKKGKRRKWRKNKRKHKPEHPKFGRI